MNERATYNPSKQTCASLSRLRNNFVFKLGRLSHRIRDRLSVERKSLSRRKPWKGIEEKAGSCRAKRGDSDNGAENMS